MHMCVVTTIHVGHFNPACLPCTLGTCNACIEGIDTHKVLSYLHALFSIVVCTYVHVCVEVY